MRFRSQALALMWLGPVIPAVQGLVPPTMRATASASVLFINNLLGIGAGTLFFGAVSDLYGARRSEAHTSELQSLMRISSDVSCLNKNTTTQSAWPTTRQHTEAIH